MKHYFRFLILVLVCVIILPLAVRPMIAPDETRYAEIAREMIETGDWIVPRLNGVRYFEKPILGYWAFAGSMKVLGLNRFALRLVSALAALLTGLFLFSFMKKTGARNREAILGMAVYLTMPLVTGLATAGTLDTFFTLWVTLSTGIFLLARDFTTGKGQKFLLYFLCGVCAGLAFLTKGFLGFAFPCLTIAGYLIWKKRWKDLFILPWIPLLGALLVIAPWAIKIHQAEPDYWRYFLVEEHWKRFFGGDNAQHTKSFYFFIPVLLGGAAFWLPLMPLSVRSMWHKETLRQPFCLYALCWLVLPFLLLSFSSGKLATYILPCFAPLSLLTAHGLAEWTRNCRAWNKLPMIFFRSFSVLLIVGTIVFTIHFLTGWPKEIYFKSESWKWMIICICTLTAAFALFSCSRKNNIWMQIRLYPLILLLLFFAAQFGLPGFFIERRCPVETFKERIKIPDGEKFALVSWSHPFHSVCWYFKRSDVYMGTTAEIEYGLKYPDAKHRLIQISNFDKFVKDRKKDGMDAVYVILPTDRFHERRNNGDFGGEILWHYHGTDDDCYCISKY